ncbi:hypothetical protein IEQ34_008235 [Dendrobium chrysotoxum]|uniref:RING-type domain-containing protein n=1 Tax=Dendrobium chrysotoxum TaxID=161865 RepID=A0AAV7H820_DENCH|nr:hypothetical protein IEQ34_008235 [Dendrobium chrysotoxum]
MSYATAIITVVLFLVPTITFICYLICFRSTAAPSLQPEHKTETRLSDTTLEFWPNLTYAEAKRQDPRAATAGSCSICLVDYDEKEKEGKDQPLRLLPDCGHLFHAVCLDPWLLQHGTCPLCRSSVMNVAKQMPLADAIPFENLKYFFLFYKQIFSLYSNVRFSILLHINFEILLCDVINF